VNRITPVSRYPLDRALAIERAQIELSAVWFLKRLGFRESVAAKHATVRAQSVLRSFGVQKN
jgi:hypothetical protein